MEVDDPKKRWPGSPKASSTMGAKLAPKRVGNGEKDISE
jgi:hypothetical protein